MHTSNTAKYKQSKNRKPLHCSNMLLIYQQVIYSPPCTILLGKTKSIYFFMGLGVLDSCFCHLQFPKESLNTYINSFLNATTTRTLNICFVYNQFENLFVTNSRLEFLVFPFSLTCLTISL